MTRPAETADLAWLVPLDAACFGRDAWSEGLWRQTLWSARVLVLPEQAYAVVAPAGDAVDLQRIAVAPEHRRRGLAATLLAAALDPADRVLLEVAADNAAALALYERGGFTELDRRPRYYRDGRDALVLERPPRVAG